MDGVVLQEVEYLFILIFDFIILYVICTEYFLCDFFKLRLLIHLSHYPNNINKFHKEIKFETQM